MPKIKALAVIRAALAAMRKEWKNGIGTGKLRRHSALGAAFFFFWGVFLAWGARPGSSEEKVYYALEINGQVYGYVELTILEIEGKAGALLQLQETAANTSSALGVPVDTRGSSEYWIDPETGRFSFFEQEIDSGSLKLHLSASIEGNKARIRLQPGGGEKEVSLPSGVLLENPYYFPDLLKKPGEASSGPKVYPVLDLLDRKIHKVTVTRRGPEPFELGGKVYRAILLESLDQDIGLRARQWINADNGYLLKAEGPRSSLSLADRSVKNKVQMVNIDNHFFAKAGAAISDIPALSYLKVRAKLEPVGNWITADSLRVSGQSFEGKVEDNRIEGVFEVRHEKYDGRNAPSFPPDFDRVPKLRPFLAPEDFIESDDPVLIMKAKELAAGAKDSWEAAKRLSQWVAEEIGYDIPGGASARNTYDTREGECGAHSRLLAAFCRGMGIPARVVWGCMYVPHLGGSFGQHAWNEVYMGEAGWIPMDTTAREVDYVDSGHIRLGILASAHVALNPKQMEILDFQAGAQNLSGSPVPMDTKKYQPYLGRYKGRRGIIIVSLQDGGLSLTLDDKRVFGLREPDEKGEWLFKLSPDIGVTFERDASGRVNGLSILNRVRLPKKGEPQSIPDNVPENLRPYLGQYSIPMQKGEVLVAYDNGHLALHIPGLGVRAIEGPDAQGVWNAKPGDDRFSFIRDEGGKVRTMILIELVRNVRVD
jgi:transglutaminase-like putative cysteine protease